MDREIVHRRMIGRQLGKPHATSRENNWTGSGRLGVPRSGRLQTLLDCRSSKAGRPAHLGSLDRPGNRGGSTSPRSHRPAVVTALAVFVADGQLEVPITAKRTSDPIRLTPVFDRLACSAIDDRRVPINVALAAVAHAHVAELV